MSYLNAFLDTLTLYNYDKDVFESFAVPGDMDKQNVIDSILLETTGLSVIYPSPDFISRLK